MKWKQDVWFEPELVVEIVASEITLSPIHKTALNTIRKNSGLHFDFQNLLERLEWKKLQKMHH